MNIRSFTLLGGLFYLAGYVPTAMAVTYNETINNTVVGSKFGNNSIGRDSYDGFFVGSASEGNSRGIQTTGVFIGSGNSSSLNMGILAVARTASSSTGNLTYTGQGGSLQNRFVMKLDGTGHVSMGSAVSAWVDVNAGSATDAFGVNVQQPGVAGGTSITNYYGVRVWGGSVAGQIDNNYAIKVDSLVAGANKYGLYVTSDPTFLGGTLTIDGEVSGAGVTMTSAASKLVKTNSGGKIDSSLLNLPANILTTTGNGSQLTGLTKAQVGLSNVDDTSDLAKPVSTAQQAADAAIQVYSIQRGNHTGTQPISSVTGLQTTLDSKLTTTGDGSNLTGITAGQVVGLAAADAAVQAHSIQRQNHTGTQPIVSVSGLQAALDTKLSSAGNGSQLTGVVHGWTDLLHVYYDEPTDAFNLQDLDSTDAIGIHSRTLFGNWIATGNFNLQGALSLPDNVRQTFNPGATVAGLNVGTVTVNPTATTAGDIWYNTTSGRFSGTFGSTVHNFVGETLNQTLTNKTISGANNSITNLNASQLTTGVVPAARGGAGAVTGILKANGTGTVSPAEAGTDYLAPGSSGATLTGLSKTQIGLGNVDNTSDAAKNSAPATLSNKALSGANNQFSNIPQSAITNLSADLASKADAAVTITAGAGLTGGGDLASSISIALSQTTLDALANAGSGGLAPNGDGSGLMGITATQVNALSSSGGTVDGDVAITGSLTAATIVASGVIRVAPAGNLDMGIFTAGTNPNPAQTP